MDLESIIQRLMIPDTEVIQNATKDLEHALTLPQTVPGLFNIMTGHVISSYRQLSAMLLKKYVHKSRNYQKIPLETRQTIRNLIVSAVFNEKENPVRASMILFLSEILRHENKDNYTAAWVSEVLQYILSQCCSTDANAMEISAFVFAKLADVSPKLFVNEFNMVRELFQMALFSVEENSANISPTVVVNVLTAMSALVPKLLGCNTQADQTYEAAVPHIVNATNRFAAVDLRAHFTAGLDILQNMAEYSPMLLNQHLLLVMEFACAISCNISYVSEMRIQALHFMFFMVGEKKKSLMKLNLVEPILKAIFNIMASEPESDDPEEFFMDSEIESPLASATIVIDKMATKLPPEKFIPPLLALIEPALNSTTDNLRRRAAYIALATIAEGCREAITEKYLKPMLNVLKQGLNDPVMSVRNAALFAVGQFSEQLQPEIAEYANDVLPFLFKYVQDILQAYRMGQHIDTKCTERVFYALESFCDSMEDNSPYMESFMSLILTILSDNFPHRLKIFAMALIASAAQAVEESLLPWFQQLIEKLRPLLLLHETCINGNEQRSYAIFALAAIARNVDKQFLPFASETMQQSLVWIESTDDIDIHKSVINLFGALASIVGENLAPILPNILNHISRYTTPKSDPIQYSSEPEKIDLETESNTSSDGQSNASSDMHFCGNNSYADAQMQSISTIRELAESCMKILLPHAQELFETLYSMIDNESDDLRKISIAATKSFAIQWNLESSSEASAKQALHILLTKSQEIVRHDDQSDNVIEALEAICDIIELFASIALPTKESREPIVQWIKQGLTYEYKCLSNEDTFSGKKGQHKDDCESDQCVIEGSANLLIALSIAVEAEEFAEYFKFLEPHIIRHIVSSTDIEYNLNDSSGHLIGILAHCYAPLGKNITPYFVKHYTIMIRGSKLRTAKIRQNAIYGLGELVRVGNELAYGFFPEILHVLSDILENEEKSVVLNSIAGALARLILTNHTLVPLQQVIPTMLQILPNIDEPEGLVLIECFDFLYDKIPEIMQAHTAAVVHITNQLSANRCSEKSFVKCFTKLMKRIKTIYPDDHKQALGALGNPD